jgi:hypothetical protein
MAVTRTGSVLDIHSTANSSSQVITVPADATLMIVGGAGQIYSGPFATGGAVTLNSVGMTLIRGDDTSTSYGNSGLFRLLNPATGDQTLAWNWAGTDNANEGFHIFVAFYKGNNTDAAQVIKSNGGQMQTDIDATTGSMAAASGDLALAVVYNYGNHTLSWSGATEVSHDLYNAMTGGFAEATPSAAVEIICTGGENYVTISGCVIAAAAGAAPNPRPSQLAPGQAVLGSVF